MENRSRLDEIEDYNFTVKNLVYKDFTELEVVKLLEKRGLDSIQIDKLLNEVKRDYSGIRMIESSPTVKTFSRIIDLVIIVAIIMGLDWLIPEWIENNTLKEWLAIIIIILIYYIPLGFKYGITLGKLITGSQVVDEYLETPSILKLFVRLISRLIPNIKLKKMVLMKYSLMTFAVNKKKLRRIKINKPSA